MRTHIAGDEGYQYISLDDYKNYFYHEDLDIASMLLCKKYSLVDIVPKSRTKMIFVFNSNPSIHSEIDRFWSNKIKVKPLEFANHRKNLKTRIFSLQKSY